VSDEIRVVVLSKPVERRSPVCGGPDLSDLQLIELMDHHKLRHIPVVDSDRKVLRLAVREEVGSRGPLALAAVILAGTDEADNAPRNLRRTVDHLRSADLTEIHILTADPNQLAADIRDAPGISVTTSCDAGAASVRSQLSQLPVSRFPWLVIDGAIESSVNLTQMLNFHRDHDATVTMGVRRYELKVPYGVISTEGSLIRSLHEKPKYQFVVNDGIFIVEPTLIGRIDRSCRTMADVVNQLLPIGETVATFPLVEYWFDIPDLNDSTPHQPQTGSTKWAA